MSRGLSEVVYQMRLKTGDLAPLFVRHPGLRILFTPASMNGGWCPSRFLVSVSGHDGDVDGVRAALAGHLENIRIVRETESACDLMADVAPDTKQLLESTLGQACAKLDGELVHRPMLLRAGWLHANVVVSHEGSVEEAVALLGQLIHGHGLEGRLSRLNPHASEHQPLGAFEDALTPKQSEILRVALALGLYDTPRRCNLESLAAIFGISKAAAHNRMKGAERKVLAHYFQ